MLKMLDGLKFWGINPDLIVEFPYNAIAGFLAACAIYFLFRHAIFVLKRNELERNLVKFPGLAEVRAQLGDLFFDRKYYRSASLYYMQAIDMHPGLHYARIRLAEIHFMAGEKEKAVGQLKEVIKRTSEEKFKYGVKVLMEKWSVPPEEISAVLNG